MVFHLEIPHRLLFKSIVSFCNEVPLEVRYSSCSAIFWRFEEIWLRSKNRTKRCKQCFPEAAHAFKVLKQC